MRLLPGNGRQTLSCLLAVCLLLAATFGRHVLTAVAQNEPLTIHLEWPNEGETLYAGPTSLLYSIPVKGVVHAPGLDLAAVTVRLDVLQGGVPAGTLDGRLQPDASFEFLVTVNPEGSDGRFPSEHLTCGDYCHLPGDLNLPAGAVTLRLTAVDSRSGQQAQVERHITVDRSAYATIPVAVQLAGAPAQPVAGVQVHGSTWLYMWRSRSFSGATDSRGQALVRVEALAAAATEYVFRVAPTVVDGVLYTGVTTATLTLPPGATAAAPLTLTVSAHTGQVTGTLAGPRPPAPLPVWAIQLPAGKSVQTVADQGSFSFAPLPIGRYLLALDESVLLSRGLSGQSQMVDLFANYQAVATMPLRPATGMAAAGRVLDEAGTPLPFAWVTAEQSRRQTAVLPPAGAYLLPELPPQGITLLANAPGYYSQAILVNLSSGPAADVDITLRRRPGTHHMPWGEGTIVVPVESQAGISGSLITLERGWLWGRGEGGPPVVIRTPAAEITVTAGEFALEYLPEKHAWLYLVHGRAQVRSLQSEESIQLHDGQMVNLLNNAGLQAVKLDPVVITALHSDSSSPLPLIWEPTWGARIRHQLARAGVNAAQLITLVTYFLVISLLFIIPLWSLYWRWRGSVTK